MRGSIHTWLALGVALVLAIVVGACAGHDWATPADLWRAAAGDQALRSRLLVDWRIPRVLAAALVGALLGLGGVVFQGVFRNPLAEPYLLGSAGGAALGATVALLVPLAMPQSILLPLLAFAGAWGATVLVIGNPGVSRGRVEAAYDAARGRFPSWLTAQRLESFKLYYLAAQWASFRDPLHLAMQTASSAATTGDPAWDLTFLSKVRSVTLADVRARWPYWTTSARTRVILEPAKTSAPLAPKKKGATR